MLSAPEQEKARLFIYRNARPLDLYRWQYHFEGGAPEQVIKALSAYQNPDGGFGHALEADAWNPHSSPVQTGTAVNILQETGFADSQHPLARGILRYLDSGADFEDGRWLNTVSTNNGYPHAPWWHTDSSSTSRSEFNPTAILTGFLLAFAPHDSALFEKGKAIAKELAASFLNAPEIYMHPLMCVDELCGWIRKARLGEALPLNEMQAEVSRQAARLIEGDKDSWGGYACMPSRFIRSPEHPLYGKLRELVTRELAWLCDTRNDQGVWNLTWKWDGYEKEFAISENWWKADILIHNMRFLKAFGWLETA